MFSLRDTVFSVSDFKLKRKLTIEELHGIWVFVEDSEGNEIKINCGSDYKYDCESHEFELLNRSLIKEESILQIYWI